MPVVLVHGVPETTAVWDRLAPLLDGAVVRLALPGFGNRRPEGFGSTMDDYLEWLERELAALDAQALDEEMSDSILKLYRSATDIPADWGPGNKPTEPGLVIGADNDPFVSARVSRKAAEELGVPAAILEGAGHWWPLDSADKAAEALQKFWASLPA